MSRFPRAVGSPATLIGKTIVAAEIGRFWDNDREAWIYQVGTLTLDDGLKVTPVVHELPGDYAVELIQIGKTRRIQ